MSNYFKYADFAEFCNTFIKNVKDANSEKQIELATTFIEELRSTIKFTVNDIIEELISDNSFLSPTLYDIPIKIQQLVYYVLLQHEDIIVKHIIFRIYYHIYIQTCDVSSLKDIYNEKHRICEVNYDLSYEADYKRDAKYYKDYRMHNDQCGSEVIIPFKKMYNILDTKEKQMNGHKIPEYQKEQLSDLEKYDLFKIAKDDRIWNKNSITNKKFLDYYIPQIDACYNDIRKRYELDSQSKYFKTSVDFYQLELMLRIETKYLISKAIDRDKIDNNQMDYITTNISYIQEIFAQDIISCQNGIIIGMNDIINVWGLYDYDLNFLRLIILFFNSAILHSERHLCDHYNLSQIDYNWLMCPKSEKFFQDYFGDGQHITLKKKWSKCTLSNFRKLYNK